MKFHELLNEIQARFHLEEKRALNEEYLEVVIPTDILPQLSVFLESYFGVPLKAKDKHPSDDANRYSRAYGGIQQNQTMYFRHGDQVREMALLWPWGCGTLVTLKVIQEKLS